MDIKSIGLLDTGMAKCFSLDGWQQKSERDT